jgi:cell division protein FtsI/penicillin-binding protein 2
LIAQLIRLQVFEHEVWIGERDKWQSETSDIVPERGRIWDRNGVLLAGNEPRYQVALDRTALTDSRSGSDNLAVLIRDAAPVLGLTPEEISRKLAGDPSRLLLKTDLDDALGKRAMELGLSWIEVEPYWKRVYPEGPLAAAVLGFYNAERKGYYGLEAYYQSELAGHTLSVEMDRDVWRDPLPLNVPPDLFVPPGADLILTIDRTIQMIVEEELSRALEGSGAASGLIIAMDPRTGAILAMANAPSFDPNKYTDTAASEPARFVNPAVNEVYEPGSVFKIVTLAAALDSGLVTPESTYVDTACLEVGGRSLCNWDRESHGVVTMVEMMARSLNVGAATLSMRMGAPTFYNYVGAFGFGNPTGVDLQGEVTGHVRTPADVTWYESDLGTNAFGQGLSVTPLQMIAAVAAVANDGVLVRPHVVKTIVESDRVRSARHARTVEVGHPIRPETARILTDVLVKAVAREVPQAQVPGYRIAGKTGTAQIPIPAGYDDPWTIASFVGYGPATDPRLIILVRLDRPTISPYGSTTAAPVFQRVAARLFPVLGIPPDSPDLASTP